MADYTVELFDRSFAPALPAMLTLKPLRYSSNAVGGYEQAEIEVSGPALRLWEALRWLRYYVVIRNPRHNAVWAGIITQAEIDLGGLQAGRTLDGMANRVAVAYNTTDANGNSVSGKTAYVDDTESQACYGVIELLQSEGDTDADQATAIRDIGLSALSHPVHLPSSVRYGSEGGGTLLCRGLWSTLEWRIWNQAGGVVRYEDTGSYEHLLGWGLTSNQIAFKRNIRSINDLNGNLGALRTDDQVIVSGAANGANNGTFTVKSGAIIDFAKDTHTYTATTIRFEVIDDILDTDDGFGFVQAGQLLKISGSSVSGNNGYHWARGDLANDHITVSPQTIANSGAGPSVTIEQGHGVQTTGSLVDEFPANTVTITSLGLAVGQSFTLPVDAPFLAAEVYVRVKKVGSPTDNVWVGIQSDASGVPSNTNLEAVSVAGSTIGDEMNWVKFTLSITTALVYGTTYWLVVGRTGSNSPTDYYVLDLNEDAGYTGGAVKLWTGAAWVARTAAADMPFQIWAHRQTTDQIDDILNYADQLLSAIDIQNASGRDSRQFRNAEQTAREEIEKLMKAGDTNQTRFLAQVMADRTVQLYTEPTYDAGTALLLDNVGALNDISGRPYEPGKLPVGKWVKLTGIPANIDEYTGIDHEFVERAEWDVESGRFSALEFKGAQNPFDVVRLI